MEGRWKGSGGSECHGTKLALSGAWKNGEMGEQPTRLYGGGWIWSRSLAMAKYFVNILPDCVGRLRLLNSLLWSLIGTLFMGREKLWNGPAP
jgi:hypothetical protein